MKNGTSGFSYALIVLSVVLLVASMVSKANGPLTPLPSEWVFLLTFSLLIPFIKLQLAVDVFLMPRVDHVSKSINDALADGKIRRIGDANKAADVVAGKLPLATKVFNTYIVSEVAYTTATSKKVEDAIVQFLGRDDVVYEETVSEQGKIRTDKFIQRFGGKPNSYKGRVIENNFNGFPVCNFIILFYEHDAPVKEEVFFGWGYFEGNPDELVLWSNDSGVTGFFRGYHKALRKNTVSHDYVYPSQQDREDTGAP